MKCRRQPCGMLRAVLAFAGKVYRCRIAGMLYIATERRCISQEVLGLGWCHYARAAPVCADCRTAGLHTEIIAMQSCPCGYHTGQQLQVSRWCCCSAHCSVFGNRVAFGCGGCLRDCRLRCRTCVWSAVCTLPWLPSSEGRCSMQCMNRNFTGI
jgi:hypothetical protein